MGNINNREWIAIIQTISLFCIVSVALHTATPAEGLSRWVNLLSNVVVIVTIILAVIGKEQRLNAIYVTLPFVIVAFFTISVSVADAVRKYYFYSSGLEFDDLWRSIQIHFMSTGELMLAVIMLYAVIAFCFFMLNALYLLTKK